MRPYNLDHLSIEEVAFIGGSFYDQSSATAFCAGLMKVIEALPTGPAKAVLLSTLSDRELMERLYRSPPEAPEFVEASANYLMPAVGWCLNPILANGERVEMDPERNVDPGDLCNLVSTLAIGGKIALYLGQYRGGAILDAFPPPAPALAHLFFQFSPLCCLAVADRDLVAMQKIVAIHGRDGRRAVEPWSFDVQHHPDLEEPFAHMALDPVSPTDTRPLTHAIHESFRSFVDRVDELMEETH